MLIGLFSSKQLVIVLSIASSRSPLFDGNYVIKIQNFQFPPQMRIFLSQSTAIGMLFFDAKSEGKHSLTALFVSPDGGALRKNRNSCIKYISNRF
jgi:hypothetical protein